MRLLWPLLLAASVGAEDDSHPVYDRLLGKSHFKNRTEIEDFIMKQQELNAIQSKLFGIPETAADSDGRSMLDKLATEQPVRPDLLPYLYEGDIILTDKQMDKIIKNTKRQLVVKDAMDAKERNSRSLTADTSVRWRFPIAYWIDARTGVSSKAVQDGVSKWQELTCATFTQYNSQPQGIPSLRFIRGDGCYSYVGQSNPSWTQEVSIGTGCTSLGTVTHEIGHALGFYHEQARPERDDFVIIRTENIGVASRSQFTKQSARSVVDYGVVYDYGSVMHYDGYGFSSNRGQTITTLDANYQSTIGQREGPSFSDVKQVNFAYCNTTCANAAPLNCQYGGYIDPKNCGFCRCPNGLSGTLCEQVTPSLSPSCGDGELTALSSTQQLSVAGDTDCYYRIKAPAGRRVFVSFTTITFPGYTPCTVSYAEVKYHSNFQRAGARICGSMRPSSVTSEGSEMIIIYKGGSSSRLALTYRYDPATPVIETTTSVPTPSTPPGPTSSSTTTSTTTTTTAAPTTTSTLPPTTTTPISACQWSTCTADCGGCGTMTRICNGFIETQYCNLALCRGNFCCRPFTYVRGYSTCIYDARGGGWGGGGGWWDNKGKGHDASEVATSPVEGDSPATTTQSTDNGNYTLPENEKHTLHVQPPEFPIEVILPPDLFRPPETVVEVTLGPLPQLGAAPPEKKEEEAVEGSGEAPSVKNIIQIDDPRAVPSMEKKMDTETEEKKKEEEEMNRIIEENKKMESEEKEKKGEEEKKKEEKKEENGNVKKEEEKKEEKKKTNEVEEKKDGKEEKKEKDQDEEKENKDDKKKEEKDDDDDKEEEEKKKKEEKEEDDKKKDKKKKKEKKKDSDEDDGDEDEKKKKEKEESDEDEDDDETRSRARRFAFPRAIPRIHFEAPVPERTRRHRG